MVRSKSSPRKKSGLIQDKWSRFLDLHIVKLPVKKIYIKDEWFVFCTVHVLKDKNDLIPRIKAKMICLCKFTCMCLKMWHQFITTSKHPVVH